MADAQHMDDALMDDPLTVAAPTAVAVVTVLVVALTGCEHLDVTIMVEDTFKEIICVDILTDKTLAP